MGTTTDTTQTRRLRLSRETIAVLTQEVFTPAADVPTKGPDCVNSRTCSAECPPSDACSAGCSFIFTICVGN